MEELDELTKRRVARRLDSAEGDLADLVNKTSKVVATLARRVAPTIEDDITRARIENAIARLEALAERRQAMLAQLEATIVQLDPPSLDTPPARRGA